MSDGTDSVSAAPVVKAARRRARFQAVKGALRTTLGLVFLALAAGFAVGMWDEVATAPGHYADVERRAGLLGRLAASSAHLLASFHHTPSLPDEPPSEVAIVNEEPRSHRAPSSRKQTPAGGNITEPEGQEPKTTDVDRKDPGEIQDPDVGTLHADDPAGDDDSSGDTERVPSIKIPRKTPRRLPTQGDMDAKSRRMLDKAHEYFETAWKHYQKTRPEAPNRDRGVAAREAIAYFKAARAEYEAVLKRDIPKPIQKKIEDRLVLLNRALFWTNKFSSPR